MQLCQNLLQLGLWQIFYGFFPIKPVFYNIVRCLFNVFSQTAPVVEPVFIGGRSVVGADQVWPDKIFEDFSGFGVIKVSDCLNYRQVVEIIVFFEPDEVLDIVFLAVVFQSVIEPHHTKSGFGLVISANRGLPVVVNSAKGVLSLVKKVLASLKCWFSQLFVVDGIGNTAESTHYAAIFAGYRHILAP